jgi:hypothetical protein
MAEQHLYLALQRLTLTNNQWTTLRQAMRDKGERNNDPNPSLRNHWRESLDGAIIIFEATFEGENIDVDWFVAWVSGVFGVNAGDVGEVTGHNIYGRFSTFSYPAGVTNRFRIGIFGFVQGGGWPDYLVSLTATLTYIADNISDWEAEILP